MRSKYIVSKPPCSPCLRVRSFPKIYFKTACTQACIAVPKATDKVHLRHLIVQAVLLLFRKTLEEPAYGAILHLK